ncbi:MAG: zf-HC2 domain-containing protein [Gemmatimonadaceae bacterium]|nr:zf-HC2 domain-containing protein [Gemmatimonadaceae bacterium]
MTECRNPELQDLLPDFAAELLDEAQTAQVAGHVAMCRPCADDLQLLRVVQQLRPTAPNLDIARIVAALPMAAGRSTSGDGAVPSIVRDIATAPSMRTRPGLTPRRVESTGAARRSFFAAPTLRAAAVLGVLLAGAASVVVSREGINAFGGAGSTPVAAESVMTISALPDSEAFGAANGSVSDNEVSVSYGDLGNYTDEELERMLDRLEKWDGVVNTEPLQSGLVNTVTGGAR